MHNITFISALGWILSVLGWTLFNVLLSLAYSTKESLTYSVRAGFINHFGGNGHWWCVLIVIVSMFCVFELGVSSIHKAFWPTDVDIFQELEKDKVLSRRFQEAAAGTEVHDVQGEEQKRREGEVQDLLDNSRVMPSRKGSNRVGLEAEFQRRMSGAGPHDSKGRPSVDVLDFGPRRKSSGGWSRTAT
jgi:phospholipid-translocating ATPase